MRTRADLSERALGECVDYEHDALSHLGNCLVSLGPERYDEAEACLRRALKMSEGARAVEARGQLVLDDEKERDYTCLARCLGKSSTDVAKQQEAESLARRVWSKRAQAWGPEHEETRAAAAFVNKLRENQARAALQAGIQQLLGSSRTQAGEDDAGLKQQCKGGSRDCSACKQTLPKESFSKNQRKKTDPKCMSCVNGRDGIS